MLETIKQVSKQSLTILLLIVSVLVLWEIPHYAGNDFSHKDRVIQLGTNLSPFEIKTFLHHFRTRLPYYREGFQRAEQNTQVSWILLAAMAYQESKWNRHAISPTGVRGLMMLTRATASDLGIKNRLDPLKSIAGGSRYLASLQKRLPSDIYAPDRMFVALAAYNVGLGHIKDARLLAKRLGKDSTRWDDLKQVLPLLAKKKYYKDLPHRYARGWEPVEYVRRIRAYHKILRQVVNQEKQNPQIDI